MTVAMLFNTSGLAFAGREAEYTVKPGDTLYSIGKRFGSDYLTVMKKNDLVSETILPGMKLTVPSGESTVPSGKSIVYTVKTGDTLYGISRKHTVRVTEIKEANRLTENLITPGMNLTIPRREARAVPESKVRPVFSGRFSFTRDDIYLLARLIHAEARGESLTGQIAVGAVILNRMASEEFPGSISDVIFQKTRGVYQFTPVQDGQINLEPNQTSFYAAERAINGEDPTGGALFFYNPETSSDRWIRTLPVMKVIGNHVFAR